MKENEAGEKKHILAFSGRSDSVIYMYRRQREVIKRKSRLRDGVSKNLFL